MFTQKQQFFLSNNISKFSHHAMNSVFELFISEENEEYAEQAAFEVFNEIDRLEQSLSRFRPNSEITRINNLKSGERIIVDEDVMNCLVQSKQMYDLTSNIFDITLGRLIQKWKDDNASSSEAVNSGFKNLIMNIDDYSVSVTEPVNIDLGGIGKGFAADKISAILDEWEIKNFLISAGGSTIKLNHFNENSLSWPITITNPINKNVIQNIKISTGSLSASGLKKGDHIINPTDFKPVKNRRVSTWVHCENATISDSLSTAFIILDIEQINKICETDKTLSCLIIDSVGDEFKITKIGTFFNFP